MSRTLIDAPTLAALQAAHVRMFLLVELGFDAARVYLCDLPFAVDWEGHTYQPTAGIGRIDPITETDVEARGIVLTLSGVTPDGIATALAEEVQGREALVRLAVVDGGTLRVDPIAWRGVMDVMAIEDNGTQPVIKATCEHELIAWRQGRGDLFSDAEQQARHPGDKAFEYAAQIAEATIVWPSAAFFKV